MNNTIQIISGLTPKERKNNLHWLVSLPEGEFLIIQEQAIKKYRQLKLSHGNIPQNILFYCCIILTARKHGWDTIRDKGYRVAGPDQYKDWSHIRDVKVSNLSRDRPSPKKRQVLALWGEVTELKNGNIGFRRIASYLKKYKKINVSPSYIHMLWCDMQRGGNNND